MRKIILILVLIPVISLSQIFEKQHQQLILRGATLINSTGAPPLGPVDIVIEKNIITKIQNVGYPGIPINENRRPKLLKGGVEINCEGSYILPGFIDTHGHIGGRSQGANPEYVFIYHFFLSSELKFLINFSNWLDLESGFFVIDLFIFSGVLIIFPGSFRRLQDDIKMENIKIK